MDLVTVDSSDQELVFLKDGMIVEPLMNGWHAWPHTIPALQHGLNVLFRQIPMMRAFLANAAFHEAASRNPDLAGGAYLDYSAGALAEISAFLKKTEIDAASCISFAQAIIELDRLIQERALGGSLATLYVNVPKELKGVIELVYNRNGTPALRVLEPLIYCLGLNRKLQQIHIFTCNEDERKFFLTAPVVSAGEGLVLNIPFSDPIVDALAQASLNGISRKVLLSAAQEHGVWNEVAKLLSITPPRQSPKLEPPEGIRISYFGHACVLIESSATSVLLDPVLAWNRNAADGRYTYADLPKTIDLIAISHGHHDHFSPETLIQLRHKTKRIVVPQNTPGNILDPSLKLMLAELGFNDVIALECCESLALPNIRLTAIPFFGEHGDLDISSKQGLAIEIGNNRLVFLVDSNVFDAEAYSKVFRGAKVDALFIGMECHGAPMSWLYGPLLGKSVLRKNDEARRLSASDSEKALQVVRSLNPDQVFVYAMGLEPWIARYAGFHFEENSVQLREARRFVGLCKLEGHRAALLRGSQTIQLDPP